MIKCAVLIHGSPVSLEKSDTFGAVCGIVREVDPVLFSGSELQSGSELPSGSACLSAPAEKSGSIYARAALAWLWRGTYGTSCPHIYKDKGGKPHFCGGRISLSLSHSGAVSVAAISDGGEVGVDVQCVREVSHLRCDAAFRRFFCMTPDEILSTSAYGERGCGARDIEIKFIDTERLLSEGTARGNGAAGTESALSVKRLPIPSGDDKYLAAFSVAEAVMKADGAGLCGGKRLPEIIGKCHSVYDFYEISGARYFISAALIPEKINK